MKTVIRMTASEDKYYLTEPMIASELKDFLKHVPDEAKIYAGPNMAREIEYDSDRNEVTVT